ncbi:gamma-glutamyl-gamma-aminobutyrate hydrolase family protein [Denitromonas iodatirespirans]|uniref:gamma-glutamyl-gamma-aminobutyrate hydrolase n=1 Tax=Denitromonas iodatirespirans TaxID=2795389 RepID=A0A944DN06_DENI1|nr:gamma-glutamyl-gamma-aminobutyrate hydrolase family protein [Denitromonas iodatirespirans]MBT0961624.1 gamma-glutamyl-gamma-aminobutyrate hydrolase family protein [Denitromonas iodatirespirans]
MRSTLPRDTTETTRPLILLPACRKSIDGTTSFSVGEKYIDAVRLAGGQPLLVPYATDDELDALLGLADGVLLTGSPSNVHPAHYGKSLQDPPGALDTVRDDWVLPFIPRLLDKGIPLFAICRGLQELNVALGGSLHHAVHTLPGKNDHRTRDDLPEHTKYGPAHVVDIVPGALLEQLLDATQIEVNSLHGQAIDRLAPSLAVEANAPDGVIEAVSCPGARGFSLAVQWHPEWRAHDNPHSRKLFDAFGQACRDYQRTKTQTGING